MQVILKKIKKLKFQEFFVRLFLFCGKAGYFVGNQKKIEVGNTRIISF